MSDILDTLDELDELEELDDSGTVVSVIEPEFDLDDYEMTYDEARSITDSIIGAATATFILLAEAHEHKAHRALGYETWADYVQQEFDMSAQRSYQLLDLSKAVAMIEAATPEGTKVKLTEAQARDIKRELPKITEQIREETSGLTPEEASARSEEIIEEQRKDKKAMDDMDAKAKKAKEDALAEAEEDGYRAGLEAAADAMLAADDETNGKVTDSADDGMLEFEVQGNKPVSGDLSPEDLGNLYNFTSVLNNITALPDPAHILELITKDEHRALIDRSILDATAWLNRFQTLWELREES